MARGDLGGPEGPNIGPIAGVDDGLEHSIFAPFPPQKKAFFIPWASQASASVSNSKFHMHLQEAKVQLERAREFDVVKEVCEAIDMLNVVILVTKAAVSSVLMLGGGSHFAFPFVQ